MVADSVFFVPGPGIALLRSTRELPAPADGWSGGVAVAVLRAKVGVAELARSGVLVEGAATGEDMGAGAGAGCPESWGELTGCGVGVVLDLPSFHNQGSRARPEPGQPQLRSGFFCCRPIHRNLPRPTRQ